MTQEELEELEHNRDDMVQDLEKLNKELEDNYYFLVRNNTLHILVNEICDLESELKDIEFDINEEKEKSWRK